MRCTEAQLLLNAHLDGDLDTEVSEAIARHLLRCASCSHEINSIRQMRELLNSVVEPAIASVAFIARTRSTLANRFATHLRPAVKMSSAVGAGRQWTLPFVTADEDTAE